VAPDPGIDAVFIKTIVKALVLPPAGPLLVAIAGLVLLRRRPRAARALAWLGVAGLLVLSVPMVAVMLHRLLDDSAPFDPAMGKAAQAIVILGSGLRLNAAEYGGDTLGPSTLERVRYGARLARATGLPVLVAGGVVFRGAAEGRVMRDALEQEFGVPVRWVEARSRNTHENAVNTAAILLPAGVRDVVLVAHSADMPRARAEFAEAGLQTIPAPVALPVRPFDSALDYVPSISGLGHSYRVLYEAGGEAVRRIAARMR
jgi:uncharacterized SAM-binding protein YcdF (DUF218 family)